MAGTAPAPAVTLMEAGALAGSVPRKSLSGGSQGTEEISAAMRAIHSAAARAVAAVGLMFILLESESFDGVIYNSQRGMAVIRGGRGILTQKECPTVRHKGIKLQRKGGGFKRKKGEGL